jgi:hypothetical protein
LKPCTAEDAVRPMMKLPDGSAWGSPVALVQDADADTFTGVFVGWHC